MLAGGRAPVALDLTRKFNRNGCEVYIAESIPIYLTRYSNKVKKTYHVPVPNRNPVQYIAALMEIVEKEKIDYVIPTCEVAFFIAWSKEKLCLNGCRVFVDSLNKLELLHSKWNFMELLRDKGIIVPKTYLAKDLEEINEHLGKFKAGNKVVLKPEYSRFAAKVHECIVPVKELPDITISEYTPWVVQEHIEGRQFCTYSIAHGGKVVAHTTYRSVFTAGRGAAIYFSHLEHKNIELWVKNLCQSIEYTGQIAFDFIEKPDGSIYPLECNPRTTSGMHLFSGEQLVDAIFMTNGSLHKPEQIDRMVAPGMILYGPGKAGWVKWWHSFKQAKDVIFDTDDLIPSFYQILTYAFLKYRSWRENVSIIEATSLDIEWNGERL